MVESKTRLGDWEADTIIGAKHRGAIVSLVDRKSKFTLLTKVSRKTAEQIKSAIIKCFSISPRFILHTITYDNGKEFSCHEELAKELGGKHYFATPYRSCERGLNEHTNGLVRQYFPKKTDFTKLTDTDLQNVQDKLNNRPRKVLGFKTPMEVLMGIRCPQKVAIHG